MTMIPLIMMMIMMMMMTIKLFRMETEVERSPSSGIIPTKKSVAHYESRQPSRVDIEEPNQQKTVETPPRESILDIALSGVDAATVKKAMGSKHYDLFVYHHHHHIYLPTCNKD